MQSNTLGALLALLNKSFFESLPRYVHENSNSKNVACSKTDSIKFLLLRNVGQDLVFKNKNFLVVLVDEKVL